LLPIPAAYANDYLVGIFGIPDGDWSILHRAGLNSAVIRESEINKARHQPIKKIYALGINPPALKKGIDDKIFIKRMEHFRSLKDAYNYYLAGDMNCARKSKVDYYRKLLRIDKSPMVCLLGKKAEDIRCYPDYEVFIYHYPLMRREKSLKEMLQLQADIVRDGRKKTYIFVQTHPPFWYTKIIGLGNVNRNALLYPDGQVVRMLIYYGIAAGGNGYFLYDKLSLSGEESSERLLGAAQAIIESRPLTRSLANSSGSVFFQRTSNVFGTKIKGASYDLFLIFNADLAAHYHPTKQCAKMKLNEIIESKNYKAVYKYSPLGSFPVTGEVDIPQDHALILVAFKDKANIEPFKLDPSSMELYAKILQSRAIKLAANMKSMGMEVPSLKVSQSNITTRIETIINYIDNVNEMKRNEWIKRTAGKLPTDGDIYNRLFWKKQLSTPVQKEIINFYYR
jgi:hypothetical protein